MAQKISMNNHDAPQYGFEIEIRELDPAYFPNMEFSFGTVRGMFRIDDSNAAGRCMVIGAILNDSPGNGHFRAFMDRLFAHCRDAGTAIVFENVGIPQEAGIEPGDPARLGRFLGRLGFRRIGGTHDWYIPTRKMHGNPLK